MHDIHVVLFYSIISITITIINIFSYNFQKKLDDFWFRVFFNIFPKSIAKLTKQTFGNYIKLFVLNYFECYSINYYQFSLRFLSNIFGWVCVSSSIPYKILISFPQIYQTRKLFDLFLNFTIIILKFSNIVSYWNDFSFINFAIPKFSLFFIILFRSLVYIYELLCITHIFAFITLVFLESPIKTDFDFLFI